MNKNSKKIDFYHTGVSVILILVLLPFHTIWFNGSVSQPASPQDVCLMANNICMFLPVIMNSYTPSTNQLIYYDLNDRAAWVFQEGTIIKG